MFTLFYFKSKLNVRIRCMKHFTLPSVKHPTVIFRLKQTVGAEECYAHTGIGMIGIQEFP